MKRFLILFLILMLLPSFSTSGYAYRLGDVIGTSLTTDIVAQINGYDIPSYNYQGYTYIIAEDLVNYGFSVSYDNSSRTLSLTRNYNVSKIYSTYKKPTVAANEIGKKAFNLLYTDIKTYLDGRYITSYNINGQTIILFDDLSAYGNCTWNLDMRKISLDMPGIEAFAAQTGYVDVYDNGYSIYSGNLSAFFLEGEIMVPFEHTFKTIGGAEDWMEFWNDGNTFYFTGGDCSYAYTEGDNTAYIFWSDGSSKVFHMNVAPVRVNGILFIPLRTYCEMAHKTMKWNASHTAIYVKGSYDSDLSPDEARDLLEQWIGDLGTWQIERKNYLNYYGRYYVNGKTYYQYQLKGWVLENHTTTLTWYVVSADGSEIFEEMYTGGALERW